MLPRAQWVEGPCLCSGEPWCQHVALEGCWLPLPRCRAGWLLVLPHCASSVLWLQPPDPPLTTCTSPSLCATLGAPHSGPGWGLCWCSPAPLTPLCYGLSPASFNLSHRGCLRSSPPRGVARKAGLHGWGWAHRDGAALLSPWHCLRSQGCSWCVLGMRGHGPCSCAGHAATQWQGASQGCPPSPHSSPGAAAEPGGCVPRCVRRSRPPAALGDVAVVHWRAAVTAQRLGIRGHSPAVTH